MNYIVYLNIADVRFAIHVEYILGNHVMAGVKINSNHKFYDMRTFYS